MSQATDDTGHGAGIDAQLGMAAMYDLAAPQARYLEILAQGGYVEAMEGLALSFNRANTEYLLRQLMRGERALGFVFVPHVLVAAHIDVSGLQAEPLTCTSKIDKGAYP